MTVPRKIAAAGLLAAGAIAAAGCGGGDASKYDDFETLDLREKHVEVGLGRFNIPLPIVSTTEAGDVVRNNRMQMKFELTAIVKPEAAEETAKLAERRRGQIRDGVIRVCRNSSLDDLLDPTLSTVRSRILDATQPLLDGVTLRKVCITRRSTEPL